jgi:hypothetical protein
VPRQQQAERTKSSLLNCESSGHGTIKIPCPADWFPPIDSAIATVLYDRFMSFVWASLISSATPSTVRISPAAAGLAVKMYKGIGILPQPQELRAGGWKADFTLIDDRGSVTKLRKYHGQEVYPAREDAERAGLDSARRIIGDED